MDNSTSPSPLQVPLDLSTTYGALLIGSYIGCVLWGAQILQTVWYFLNFPRDPISMKIFVVVLNLVASLDMIFEILSIWFGTITASGTIPNVFTNPYLFYRIPTFAVVVFFAQNFYLYRIYKFATVDFIKYGIPTLLLPLIFFQLIANSYIAANWLNLRSAASLPSADIIQLEVGIQTRVTKIILPLYGSACATELLIAIVMCGLLFQRRTGIGSTDKLLLNLAATSINTGIWPALVALLIVILTKATSPTDFIYASPTYISSTLYVNSILCNLNVRQFFRKQPDSGSTTKAFSSILFKKNNKRPGHPGLDTNIPDVTIDQPHTFDSGEYELHSKNSISMNTDSRTNVASTTFDSKLTRKLTETGSTEVYSI